MKMKPILDTYERTVAWRRVQEKMSVRQISERVGCCVNSVRRWMIHDPHTLRINQEHHDAFLAMLEEHMEGLRLPGDLPSSDRPVSESATEPEVKLVPDGFHNISIPVIEKEVVLVDLINQELNRFSADRLVAVYRAILSKVL